MTSSPTQAGTESAKYTTEEWEAWYNYVILGTPVPAESGHVSDIAEEAIDSEPNVYTTH